MRSPVSAEYLNPVAANAAVKDGYAARVGNKEMIEHHKGYLDPQQWSVVPFVQETFGRLGSAAQKLLRELAAHSAACKGGDSVIIRRRAGIVLRRLVDLPDASLHAELAERVSAMWRRATHGLGHTSGVRPPTHNNRKRYRHFDVGGALAPQP